MEVAGKNSIDIFKNPYVSDGLVSMYDEIWNIGFGKHDDFATSWRDLARDDETAAIQIPTNQMLEWTSKSLRSQHSGIIENHPNGPSFTEDTPFTVECTCAIPKFTGTINAATAVCSIKNTQLRFGYSNNSSAVGIFYSDVYEWPKNVQLPCNITTLAISKGAKGSDSKAQYKTYKDGVMAQVNNFTSYGLTVPRMKLFTYNELRNQRVWKDGTIVDIFAIRTYGRQLSDAEVAANAAEDIRRFA